MGHRGVGGDWNLRKAYPEMTVLMTPLTRHVGHALLLDLVCIGIIAFAVYYRRYRRADLVIAYVALNVSLFSVAVLIVSQMRIGVAFGFGLFAILSSSGYVPSRSRRRKVPTTSWPWCSA